MRQITALLLPLLLCGVAAGGESQLEVVTTLPAYASIARAVGGDRVKAESISRGDEDAHFVKPKPSFALMLKNADLFVTRTSRATGPFVMANRGSSTPVRGSSYWTCRQWPTALPATFTSMATRTSSPVL
jgi:hypothetical protein